jgi:hypothetical protein
MKNKKTLTTIANLKRRQKAVCSLSLILILATTIMMAFSQPALAQVGVPQPVKTVGYISVAPKLLGVGQTATVNLWVFPLPTNYAYQPYFKGFTGITVTFVKPDGTKDTFMPVDGTGQYAPGQTQALGAIYFFYKPDKPGNWSVYFTMPEQNITDKTGTVIYSGCTSNTAYFTVQTEPVYAGLLNGWPWSPLPLPNVYWSYPISSNNREWSQISGDWLHIMNDVSVYGATYRHWQPYGSGPNAPHILWRHPYQKGGIIGGDYGSLSHMTPTSVDKGAIVMYGKVFYNIPNGQFQCVDLASGEILYTVDGSVTCGIHLPGNPYVQSILDPSVVLKSSFGSALGTYIFERSGTKWNYRDILTGKIVRSLANASYSYAQMIDGTNLAYGIRSGKLFAWDLSKVVQDNWPTGIIWETPLPQPAAVARGIQLFGISADLSTVVIYNWNEYWGYSAKNGTQIWHLLLTYPVAANEEFNLYGVNYFIVYDYVEATFHCYSMLDGSLIWTSRSYADSPWATTWTVYNSETNDYEKLYLALPDGTVSALDLKTGEEVWRSKAFPSTEYVNNAVPFVYGCTLVGGNLYTYGGYSLGYCINPIPRFARLVCINATTGEIKYSLNGGIYPSSAANGYIIGAGIYDGYMYAIGKGPTKTTVIASPKISTQGSSVLIEGSVIDMSPVAQDYASKVRFPNGVPAVADEDMSEWMDYLYMQNATLLNNPPNPRGVSVRLTAVYPNGAAQDIGTVTTDSSGIFKKMWTPETEGEYMIYATFEGSESYWPSYGATAIGVTEAPAQPETPEYPTPTDYTPILTGLAVAIIAVAILVVYDIVSVRKLRK